MLEPGQKVGRYLIESTLGRGAMGTVYRAKDATLRRDVAVKVLEPGESGLDPEAHARFLREARAAAALDHPNIIAVYDVGEHEGQPFLAMELVIGTTLRNIIGDAGISIPMRIRWLVEIARGLEEAHTHRLVHRDVKPENVLVSSTDGTAKLTDFGIVKQRQRESNPAPQSFRTKTGQLVGTPDYMAPEQWASADVDARADQYAWGLVAYELLTARTLPLGRPHPIQTIVPSLPDTVAACITRAIEHQRDGRYPSMNEIITELEPFCAQTVTEAALTRSMPPPTHSNAEAMAIAPTLDARSGLAQAPTGDPTEPSAKSPMPTPTPTPTPKPEETARRQKHRLASSRPPSSKRSNKRTFVTAVVVTLVVAIVIIIITLALFKKS